MEVESATCCMCRQVPPPDVLIIALRQPDHSIGGVICEVCASMAVDIFKDVRMRGSVAVREWGAENALPS